MSQLTTYEVKGTKETAGSRNGKMTGRWFIMAGKIHLKTASDLKYEVFYI